MYIGPLTSAMNINLSVMVTGNLLLVSILVLACIMEQVESGVFNLVQVAYLYWP